MLSLYLFSVLLLLASKILIYIAGRINCLGNGSLDPETRWIHIFYFWTSKNPNNILFMGPLLMANENSLTYSVGNYAINMLQILLKCVTQIKALSSLKNIVDYVITYILWQATTDVRERKDTDVQGMYSPVHWKNTCDWELSWQPGLILVMYSQRLRTALHSMRVSHCLSTCSLGPYLSPAGGDLWLKTEDDQIPQRYGMCFSIDTPNAWQGCSG